MRLLAAIAGAAALTAGCAFDSTGTHSTPDASGGTDRALGADAARGTDAGGVTDAARKIDATVAPSYVSYWSFDVDATDATGAHDGVLAGAAGITSGGQGFGGGEALELSSNGDRVDVGNPTTFDFNGDFTWHVYLKTNDGSGALLSRNPLGTAWNQGSKALFVRSNDVDWDTGWVSNPKTMVTVDDGEWHQVIATFQADTNALKIFVDANPGDTVGDYDGTHEVDRYDEHTHVHNSGLAETGFSIGQANFSGGLSSLDTLVGLIDEVAVFDRALSGAELDQLISLGPRSF